MASFGPSGGDAFRNDVEGFTESEEELARLVDSENVSEEGYDGAKEAHVVSTPQQKNQRVFDFEIRN